VEGLILAGGSSQRMGVHKMLMTIDGIPLIEHTITHMLPFCRRITVVTGYGAKDVANAIAHLPNVHIVHHPDYKLGMFSSFKQGMNALTCNLFFMMPGDMPFVQGQTFKVLLKAHCDTPVGPDRRDSHDCGAIWVPSYKRHAGHPILIEASGALYEQVMGMPNNAILKSALAPCAKTYVDVEDPGILVDLDTPEDFHAHVRAAN